MKCTFKLQTQKIPIMSSHQLECLKVVSYPSYPLPLSWKPSHSLTCSLCLGPHSYILGQLNLKIRYLEEINKAEMVIGIPKLMFSFPCNINTEKWLPSWGLHFPAVLVAR